ncbi:putative ribonuclease H-like domain-containing protein [Tanacetum coccineum]
MDQDSVHMMAASKVPMLKPGEYELWRMRMEQYIQMVDYSLWEIIWNDAKSLLQAIEKRFGGNAATKKTQGNLLKQQYENFTASSSKLRRKLELAQKQKDEIQLTVENFENSSKNLSKLLDCQIVDKCKIGLGYNVVPPPYTGNFMPPKPDLSFSGLEEFVNEPIVSEPTVKKPVVETSEAKASADKPKAVKKNNGAPIIKDWVSDSEEEDMPQAKIQKKIVKPSFAKIEFVKSKEQGNPQMDLQDQGVIDSGCSRHMTRNMSYITDFEEIDKVYVTFGGNPKGGKITGRATNNGIEVNAVGSKTSIELPDDLNMPELEDIVYSDNDEDMDVKSAFLYGKIKEEVYVCQPPGFEDPNFLDIVYKVEKALYGLYQAPKSWYETLSTYLLDNGFKEKKDNNNIVYQNGQRIASKGKKRGVGFFISQDKYVTEILKKFGFTDVKTASTPMETQNPLLKDEDGQPKLGLWYPKDSPFDLVAYTNSDYAGASLDRKSTTGGCQFLGCRLISRDLQLDDEEGTYCLPNATIFEELTRMGRPKEKDTLAPHSSVPSDPTNIADEAVTKEPSMQLKELMDFFKKLEKKGGSRTHKLKRLYKIGRSARVVSSDEASLGDQEDASKQGRKINDIDADAEITLVDETQGRHDDDRFTTAGEVVTTADVAVSTASTIPVSAATITEDEITLAQAMEELKSAKPTTAASTRPKAKGLVIHEKEQTTTPTISLQIPSQVKGQGSKDKDADYQLAERLQAQEQQELTIEEKSTLFVQLLEKRQKHFAAKRAKEKRNMPPTRAQQRSIMCTYLKNMTGWKPKDLKSKSFANIQELFDKAFKMVNTFVDFRIELVEGTEMEECSKKEEVMDESSKRTEGSKTREESSSKRAGDELEQENAKKQKMDDDQKATKMKELMKIVPDEEEVAVDAIPLATKPPSIVLKSFDREDLETLWKLVKAKHGYTRPEKGFERVLWGDLKTMFEHHREDAVWRNLRENKVLVWKLFESCGVHFVRFQNLHVFMLVEKRYPLTPATITDMLNKKLQADHWNEMCYQLLKLITKQLKN